MTWDYYDIQKEDKRYSKENLNDSIDRALGRPPTEKNKKKAFTKHLRDMADAIDGRFKDELFEHESSKEAIKMIYKGFRTLQTRNRLLDARLSREGKGNK